MPKTPDYEETTSYRWNELELNQDSDDGLLPDEPDTKELAIDEDIFDTDSEQELYDNFQKQTKINYSNFRNDNQRKSRKEQINKLKISEKQLESENNKHLKNIVHSPFEIWSSEQAARLLKNRHIVFLGDSVQRCCYIDFCQLLKNNDTVPDGEFKQGHKTSFGPGERQNSARSEGSKAELNSFSYFQLRNYVNEANNTRLDYYFMSRCFSEYVIEVFEKEIAPSKPDLVVMSCMFYDMSKHHYGPNAGKMYLENLYRLKHTVERLGIKFLWRETTPLGEEAYGGFMQRKKKCNDTLGRVVKLREDIPIFCEYLEEFWTSHNFEYLAVHDYFKSFPEEREKDDIHWKPFAHRVLSFMMLTKFRRMWGIPRLQFTVLPEMLEIKDDKKIRLEKRFNKSYQNHKLNNPKQIKNLEGFRKLQYYAENHEKIMDFEGEPVFQNCEVQFDSKKVLICQEQIEHNFDGVEDGNVDWVTDYSLTSSSEDEIPATYNNDVMNPTGKKIKSKRQKYQATFEDALWADAQVKLSKDRENQATKHFDKTERELYNYRKTDKCANQNLKHVNFDDLVDDPVEICPGQSITDRMFGLVFEKQEGKPSRNNSERMKLNLNLK